jgi:hypothetical protein
MVLPVTERDTLLAIQLCLPQTDWLPCTAATYAEADLQAQSSDTRQRH